MIRTRITLPLVVVTTVLAGAAIATAAYDGGDGPAVQAESRVPGHAATCSDFSVTFGSRQGAAGSTYQVLLLTNASGGHCVLDGFPQVAFVDAQKNQVGWPAAHVTEPHGPVDVAPGQVARAALQVPDFENFPPSRCRAQNAAGVRVQVAEDPSPSYLSWVQKVCTTRFGRASVGPYRG